MLKVFFFIVFALIPLPINCGQRNSICVDCRKYKKEKCKISKTGYQCLVSGNLRRAYGSGIHIPPITTDLRKCIPKGMEKQGIQSRKSTFWFSNWFLKTFQQRILTNAAFGHLSLDAKRYTIRIKTLLIATIVEMKHVRVKLETPTPVIFHWLCTCF